MSSDKKIDKPDQVAFAKAISQNLPSKENSDRLWYGMAAAYLVGRVIGNGKK
jgi:hypothetical protein